jgi:DUF971 family protein
MTTAATEDSPPTEIRVRRRSRVVEVTFGADERYALSFEYLRVESPSAEVQGHGPGQDVLQIAKENVAVLRIEPVGHYAVRIVFDDGHDTGLYTWRYLRVLGREQASRFARYLARLEKIGYERKVPSPDVTLTPTE